MLNCCLAIQFTAYSTYLFLQNVENWCPLFLSFCTSGYISGL